MTTNQLIATVTLGFVFLTADALAADNQIPSYADAVERFQAKRATADGPKISAEDQAVMARAQQDLARQMPKPGLQPGERAPDFTLPDAHGKPVRLYDMLAEGPVVLTFYRGAWCPFCNLELHSLHGARAHFERLGASVVAVTPQTPDKSLEQVEKDGYPFPVLSDLDDRVTTAYGLRFEVPAELSDVYVRNFQLDLADYNGAGRYVLPVPGTFVIDRHGTIRAAFADTDYKQRMEPAAIVEALERIHAQ